LKTLLVKVRPTFVAHLEHARRLQALPPMRKNANKSKKS